MREFEQISIVEGTLREQLQGGHPVRFDEGIVYHRDQQCEIAELLTEFNIDYIEIGVPSSPTGHRIARDVVDVVKQSTSTRLVIHARCVESDLDTAIEYQPDEIELYLGASPQNRGANGGRTLESTIEKAKDAIEYIRRKGFSKPVRFSPEDTFRTSQEDILYFVKKIAPFVQRMGLPDTTGWALPENVESLVEGIIGQTGLPIQFHGHNDTGLAPANYYAALKAGATFFDTTILGFGERNGIMSLSAMISMLSRIYGEDKVMQKYNVQNLQKIDNKIAGFLDIQVPQSNPITSQHAFDHLAGVHAKAQNGSEHAYQSLNPSNFNRKTRLIYASAVVGGAAIEKRALELGYQLNSTQAKEVATQIRDRALSQGRISTMEADNIIFQFCK